MFQANLQNNYSTKTKTFARTTGVCCRIICLCLFCCETSSASTDSEHVRPVFTSPLERRVRTYFHLHVSEKIHVVSCQTFVAFTYILDREMRERDKR